MEGRQMKGISLIFEYVLLFMFGVMIFISSLSVFLNYQARFSDITLNDQLTLVGEYVGTNIINLVHSTDLNEDSSLIVKVPKRIGNENYVIELSSLGLNLTSVETQTTKIHSLYNLSQSMNLSGRTLSAYGSVIIYKTGNQIILS